MRGGSRAPLRRRSVGCARQESERGAWTTTTIGRPEQPESGRKTDQQIFDEQIARASGKAVVMFGGLGILAALVMSTVALVIAANKSTTTRSGPPPRRRPGSRPAAGRRPRSRATRSARSSSPRESPTSGAIGCGSCHTMKAAGANGTIGPNLDKELTADPASATRESIVDPNKEIVPGYSANVMPTNYGKALTSQELDALVNYVYHSTNTKAKASRGEGVRHAVAGPSGRAGCAGAAPGRRFAVTPVAAGRLELLAHSEAPAPHAHEARRVRPPARADAPLDHELDALLGIDRAGDLRPRAAVQRAPPEREREQRQDVRRARRGDATGPRVASPANTARTAPLAAGRRSIAQLPSAAGDRRGDRRPRRARGLVLDAQRSPRPATEPSAKRSSPANSDGPLVPALAARRPHGDAADGRRVARRPRVRRRRQLAVQRRRRGRLVLSPSRWPQTRWSVTGVPAG